MFFRKFRILGVTVPVPTPDPAPTLVKGSDSTLGHRLASVVVFTICAVTIGNTIGNYTLSFMHLPIPETLSSTTNTLTGGILSFLVGMKSSDWLKASSGDKPGATSAEISTTVSLGNGDPDPKPASTFAADRTPSNPAKLPEVEEEAGNELLDQTEMSKDTKGWV